MGRIVRRSRGTKKTLRKKIPMRLRKVENGGGGKKNHTVTWGWGGILKPNYCEEKIIS